MGDRLTTEFWVAAYLTRLRLRDIPAFVATKGDPKAGSVIVKVNTLDGRGRSFHRTYDASGDRIWAELSVGDDSDVEASLARQRSFDPDLWVIEVEDREGRHLLDEAGLAG